MCIRDSLTKRQLICFGSGALIGVPLFFLLKGSIGTSPAAMVMMVVMIPAMLDVYKRQVYKIPMVRMFALAGGLTNLRMYRSKRRPRRNVWVR